MHCSLIYKFNIEGNDCFYRIFIWHEINSLAHWNMIILKLAEEWYNIW